MKVKRVQFTNEHMLFLWKRFRYIKETELDWHFNELEINSRGCCVEIRDSYGDLKACGITINNDLTHAAVEESERGKNLQVYLINERLKFISENGFTEANMYIRCKNAPSWINAIKCGFKVEDMTRYENDDEGFVMKKKLS